MPNSVGQQHTPTRYWVSTGTLTDGRNWDGAAESDGDWGSVCHLPRESTHCSAYTAQDIQTSQSTPPLWLLKG